ncbi:MAG: BREX-3 system phosphatase PglZ [Chloroflexota bacterium]
MNAFVSQRLAPVRSAMRGVVIVLDRDRVVEPESLPGVVVVAEDWWALRREYERNGRRRPSDRPPLVIVIVGDLALKPLPWDVERECTAVASVKLPGPGLVRAALVALDGEEVSRAIAAVEGASTDEDAALLSAITGVDVRGARLSRADQLRLSARLVVRSSRPAALVDLARRWVNEPIAASLLDDPPDVSDLQRTWHDYVSGASGEWAADLGRANAEVAQLFAVGILQPVVAGAPADRWATIGVRRPSLEERARQLLDDTPAEGPTDLAGWSAVAEWWGDVRRLIAGAPTELRDSAWQTWADLDAAFLPWLRARYGTLLSSSAKWPAGVHRIAHFLARRARDGEAERVLLLVLDGLGHAQWAHLRERLPLHVFESGSTLALVPTYTTVSRQAIFAGDLPASFPDTIWTTQPEPRRWRAHWAAEGFPVTGIAYHRVKGRLPHDHLGFGDAPVTGVVVNAVDDLMHTSELFGDAQLLANLDVWTQNGFLVDLVARAAAEGIETWITADHGNLECIGVGSISEGVAIESSGKRLLRYPNRTLRDASAAEGIVWDDIPGMPSTAEPLLFAAGRNAFTNNRLSISHGGLSLDEVIVPLARVTA